MSEIWVYNPTLSDKIQRVNLNAPEEWLGRLVDCWREVEVVQECFYFFRTTCVHCHEEVRPTDQNDWIHIQGLYRCQSKDVPYGHLAHPEDVPCRSDGPNPCLGAQDNSDDGCPRKGKILNNIWHVSKEQDGIYIANAKGDLIFTEAHCVYCAEHIVRLHNEDLEKRRFDD